MGKPDPVWGEVVAAVVTLHHGKVCWPMLISPLNCCLLLTMIMSCQNNLTQFSLLHDCHQNMILLTLYGHLLNTDTTLQSNPAVQKPASHEHLLITDSLLCPWRGERNLLHIL